MISYEYNIDRDQELSISNRKFYRRRCSTQKPSARDFEDFFGKVQTNKLDFMFSDSRFSSYEIKHIIGEGGYARVYLAAHKLLGTYTAIKILPLERSNDPEYSNMIEREIRVMKMVNHPFVCKIFESFKTNNSWVIVMEYLSNGSLLEFINKVGRLSEAQMRTYFTQIILGVEHLHSKYIAHRDLKAENILIDEHGNLRIIDLGLCNFFDPKFPLMKTPCGCAAYASPEMIKGERYMPSTDVWSCGVILYAMATGSLPFMSNNQQELIQMVINNDPQVPYNISPSLADLLSKMLCKDPLKRISIDSIKQHPWCAQSIPVFDMSVLNLDVIDDNLVYQVTKLGIDTTGIEDDLKNDVENEKTLIYKICEREMIVDRLDSANKHLARQLTTNPQLVKMRMSMNPKVRVFQKTSALCLQKRNFATQSAVHKASLAIPPMIPSAFDYQVNRIPRNRKTRISDA